jgi:hypothetical protein
MTLDLSQVNKLMLIISDTLKTIIKIILLMLSWFFSVETSEDKLKIHKWYSTKNYANDIVSV